MPADPGLPLECEHLLIDLMTVERSIADARAALLQREDRIVAPLVAKVNSLPPADRLAGRAAAAAELIELRRGKFRSELADLAASIVTAERRRAKIMQRLDAFASLGESVPAIDLAFEHDGERALVIRAGAGKVFRLTLPAIIDRGVWRADGKYERGDAVTSDGSLWIAREDAPAHEPGKGPQWRLAVTRGRNGRDATNSRLTRNPA